MKVARFIYLLMLAVLLPAVMSIGQSPTFTRVFYDLYKHAQGYGIASNGNGVYAIAGVRDNRAMLAAVDDSGQLLWMKQCLEPMSRFQCVTIAHDGLVVAAGYVPDIKSGIAGLYLLKTELNGDTVFSRVIETGNDTYAQSIGLTPDHGFIITGWLELTSSPYYALFVAKTDSAGHISWIRRYHSFYPSYGYSARSAADGSYLVAGRTPGSTPFQESALFIKLSAAGDVLWSKEIQPGTGGHWSCNDIAETPDGLLLLVNNNNYDWHLVRTDAAGNFQGAVKSGHFTLNTEYGYPRPKMREISGNRFVFLTPGMGYDDQLLVVDQTGVPIYRHQVQIISADVALRPDQGFMILGNGPIMGVIMANTDNPQIGIMATDSTGVTSACAYPMIPWWEGSQFITSDYPLGSYIITTTDGSKPVMEATSLSFWDGCVAVTGAVAENRNPAIHVVVHPNPNSGVFSLSLERAESISSRVEIYNSHGKMVYYSEFDFVGDREIDLKGVPDGLYLISIITEAGVFHQKTIISPSFQ